MWRHHKLILLLYSPWLPTLAATFIALAPFTNRLVGLDRLAMMKACGPLALPLGLLGFYLCFRKRHPVLRDLAIWLNLGAIGLSVLFLYLGFL